jgi:hypothetical protein
MTTPPDPILTVFLPDDDEKTSIVNTVFSYERDGRPHRVIWTYEPAASATLPPSLAAGDSGPQRSPAAPASEGYGPSGAGGQ